MVCCEAGPQNPLLVCPVYEKVLASIVVLVASRNALKRRAEEAMDMTSHGMVDSEVLLQASSRVPQDYNTTRHQRCGEGSGVFDTARATGTAIFDPGLVNHLEVVTQMPLLPMFHYLPCVCLRRRCGRCRCTPQPGQPLQHR